MLKTIVIKEIQENLVNLWFLVVSVISVVLILSSMIVLAENHDKRLKDYNDRQAAQQEFIDTFGHANRAGWMSRQMQKPSDFDALVLGIDREADQENFVSNPIPGLLTRLDLVGIVTIIMSLMAVLYSHSLISGERESGTLRLILSTQISRAHVIVGKFIGGLVSLLLPYTLGVLIGLAYLAATGDLRMESGDLAVLFVLLAASWLYIGTFMALGLLISARSQTSNGAVLRSLFAWVLLVLVVPNVSPFLAARMYSVPSLAKIEQETRRLQDTERDEILRQRSQEILRREFPDVLASRDLTQRDLQEKIHRDPAFAQRYGEYSDRFDELARQVNREQGEKAGAIVREFNQSAQQQEMLAKFFASLSPFSNFTFLATDITETGIGAESWWESQINSYGTEFARFVESRYEQAKREDPTFSYNDYLDLRDRPTFQYQAASFDARLEAVILPFGLLCIFLIIFFAGAWVSILKYDVR